MRSAARVNLNAEMHAVSALQPENDVAFAGCGGVDDDLALGDDDGVHDRRVGDRDTSDDFRRAIRVGTPDGQVDARDRGFLRERALRQNIIAAMKPSMRMARR